MCMCSVVFVTRFLRLFSLIASSSRVETRADFVVSRSPRISDTPLLEKAPHTGVKNRGKSIVERRGAPVATTETAWQSPLCSPLSLHPSSSIPLCIFYLHLPLPFPLCSFSFPFIYQHFRLSLLLSQTPTRPFFLSIFLPLLPPSKYFLSLVHGSSVLVFHRSVFLLRFFVVRPIFCLLSSSSLLLVYNVYKFSEKSEKRKFVRFAVKKNRLSRDLVSHES